MRVGLRVRGLDAGPLPLPISPERAAQIARMEAWLPGWLAAVESRSAAGANDLARLRLRPSRALVLRLDITPACRSHVNNQTFAVRVRDLGDSVVKYRLHRHR